MTASCSRLLLSLAKSRPSQLLFRAKSSVAKPHPALSNEVRIRSALPKDYDDVMYMTSHDRKFHNEDILYSQYFKCLEDPHLRCLVAVQENKPVAFGIGQFGVDNGKSAIVHSTRSAKGTRLMGHFIMILKTIHSLDPSTEFLGSVPEGRFVARDNTHHVVFRNQYNYLLTDSDPSVNSKTCDSHIDEGIHAQRQSVKEFCELFKLGYLNEYLYPGGYFIADNLIAKPMIANAKFVREREDNIAIFISPSLSHGVPNDSTSQDQVTSSNDEQDLNNTDPLNGLLSLNTWYPCRGGFASKIQLFGQVDKPQDLESHLKAHVQVLRANRLFGPVQVRLDRDRLGMKETEFREVCQIVGLTAEDYETNVRNIQRIFFK